MSRAFFIPVAEDQKFEIPSAQSLHDAKVESWDQSELLKKFTPFEIARHFRRNADIKYYMRIATHLPPSSENMLFLQNLSFVCMQDGKQTEARQYYNQAEAIFNQVDHKKETTEDFLFQAKQAQINGPLLREVEQKTDSSITMLKCGLKFCEKLSATHPQYTTIKANLLRDLAIGFLKEKQFEQALNYFLEGLHFAEANQLGTFAIPMRNYVALATVRLATQHEDQKISDAEELFKTAEQLFEEVSAQYKTYAKEYERAYHESFLDDCQDWASHVFHKGTFFCQRKNYAVAIESLEEALRLRENLQLQGQLQNRVAEVCEWLAKAYLGNKNFETATQYADRALSIYQTLPAPDAGGIVRIDAIHLQIVAAEEAAAATMAFSS